MSARGPRKRATPARAREKPKRTRVDADAGVRDCMERMIAGTWVPGTSHNDVAFVHGVAPATVKDWATSASRVIRLLHEVDKEDVRALSLAQLQTVVATALDAKRPDLKAAIMAIAERAKLLGLIVQKHEMRPSVAHLSRAEHLAELDKLAKEIADEQKRIATEAAS